MNAPAYPFSRTLRTGSITLGNGVTTVWGPSSFKIADVLDVEVWRKDLGEEDFHEIDAVITKTGTGFSTFTVTISPAMPSTSQFFYKGRRLHERSVAITKTAQKLDADALDYELTKLGVIQQEHYREIGDLGTMARAAFALAEDAVEVVGDINQVRDAIEASEAAAKAAEDNAAMWAAQALAAAQATGDVMIYDTYAAASAGVGGVPANGIVEVLKDETRGGFRTRYRKEGGVLVFKIVIGGPRYFDVMTYGATPDFGAGNTDNTAAFQAAINDAIADGGTVFVPAGHYYFAEGSASLDPGLGGFSVVGEYGCSVLHYHEGSGSGGGASAKELFYNADDNDNKTFLYFHGLTFKGTFGDAGRTTQQGGAALFLDHYKELRFSYCRWENITWCAIDTHFNEAFSADHCVVKRVSGDGIRQRDNKYGQVTNSFFWGNGDDSISWHCAKYFEPTYNPDDGSPRREGLVATGNVFRDTSACITALGCRQAVIANNVANRFRTYFSFITSFTSEGNHPMANIKVVENIALNCISTIGAYFILGQDTAVPRGTAATDGVTPGMPHASGLFEYIWDHQNADSQKAEDAFPPIENVDISRNIFARTLPDVDDYQDWGFGLPGMPTWGDTILDIDTELRPPAGLNVVSGRVTTIKDNIICHMQEGIFLNAQATMAPAIVGSMITGNVLMDFTKRALSLTGVSEGSGEFVDLDVSGNRFNGDVYRKAAESNANGTYTSGTGMPCGLEFSTSHGISLSRNRFSNLARISTAFDNHIWSPDNVIICDPVGLGDNASNKGVRNLPSPVIGFRYIIAHCDPTDPTNYGKIKNVPVGSASTMPTTGFYPAGHYVRNTDLSFAGIDLVRGWMRITTGSDHDHGLDWLPDVLNPRSYLQVFDGWTIGDLDAGDTATKTLTVTGARPGDFVEISYQADLQGCAQWGYVESNDTVKAHVFNPPGGSTKALAGATVRASVRPRTYPSS